MSGLRINQETHTVSVQCVINRTTHALIWELMPLASKDNWLSYVQNASHWQWPLAMQIREGWEEEGPSGEWTHSKCSLNDLNRLVSKGLLQNKNLVNWCPSFRDPFPMKNVDEIVTFYHFAERGLALPSCSLFRGLLYYYGLELHHLNPNSICHISIFIHFCEAFLRIEPH
jgi:hypothetical protein